MPHLSVCVQGLAELIWHQSMCVQVLAKLICESLGIQIVRKKQIFVHVFLTFGRDLSAFWSIFLHETPQTVRYMSVVYAYRSISVCVEYFWLQSQSSN